jgi:hypothetical protein
VLRSGGAGFRFRAAVLAADGHRVCFVCSRSGNSHLYDSVLHASLTEWWPSDVLFLYHVAPMAMALFLGDDSAKSRVYRWQRWLDFLQIGIVSLSAYFFFLYVPLQTTQQPETIWIHGRCADPQSRLRGNFRIFAEALLVGDARGKDSRGSGCGPIQAGMKAWRIS